MTNKFARCANFAPCNHITGGISSTSKHVSNLRMIGFALAAGC